MRSLAALAKLPALATLVTAPPPNALPSMDAIEPMRDIPLGCAGVAGCPDCTMSPAVPPA